MFRYVHFSFLPFFDRTLTCFFFFSMNYFCIELEGYILIQILMCARPCDLFRTSFCSINIDKFLLLSVFQLDIVTLREREERATEQKEKNGWLRHRFYSLSEQHTFVGFKPNEYVWWSVHSPLSTQKPFEVKWKQNKRPSGVCCYVREWSNWPNLMIRNNIPEDWPTIIIGFMYLSFFIHLNCIQTNFTPPGNSS